MTAPYTYLIRLDGTGSLVLSESDTQVGVIQMISGLSTSRHQNTSKSFVKNTESLMLLK